jgi:hypothetical protein
MEPALQPILLRKPFSPATLPGLVMWLDAGYGVLTSVGPDVPAGGGQAVRRWKDRSASAFDTNQTVGGAQPLLLTGWRGSRPALVFDGTDDNLVYSGVEVLPGVSGGTYTIAFVADYSGNGGICSAGAGGAAALYSGAVYRVAGGTGFYQGYTAAYVNVPDVVESGAAVRCYRLGATLLDCRTAGVSTGSVARAADTADTTGFNVGVAFGVFGGVTLGEMIVYNRALSDLEIATLERWLAGRYSL